MLYTGYAEAITRVRLRKGLTQKQAAANAIAAIPGLKLTVGMWSKFETGAKKLGDSELPIIRAGLGCTETELWQESVRVQSAHYYKKADEVREEHPQYGTSMAAGILQGLWALDLDVLPQAEHAAYRQERSFLAEGLSNMFSLVNLFKDRYWSLIGQLRRDKDDDNQDR